MNRTKSLLLAFLPAVLVLSATAGDASSHREAPFVTEHPKVDGTDFYIFRSYESGREGFVTLLANYYPLQDPFAGPNFFSLDQKARYVIHIDNDGDGIEDLSFVFHIDNDLPAISIPVDGQMVAVPLKNVGPISEALDANLNFHESYVLSVVRGDLESLQDAEPIVALDGSTLRKPMDYIGLKSFPDYEAYAAHFIYDVAIPQCDDGRVFVGQRREGFGVNLGETFDLVNVGNPIGDPAAENSATEFKNVTTFALEIPIDCVRGTGDVIGGWTSSWLRKHRLLETRPTFESPDKERGPFLQVSRLGMPLVNEVVIGLPDKDLFNASHPADDLQFATYVTNPTLPEILEILFGGGGVQAPNNFPRTDLLAAFVTGVEGLNQLGFGEMIRLNTAIGPVDAGAQNNMGVLGGDLAGFPNGRRPGDDVVDIELQVAMGALCHAGLGLCNPGDAPSGLLPFTDGVQVEASQFDSFFPYLRTPLPGSPNSVNGIGEKP